MPHDHPEPATPPEDQLVELAQRLDDVEFAPRRSLRDEILSLVRHAPPHEAAAPANLAHALLPALVGGSVLVGVIYGFWRIILAVAS